MRALDLGFSRLKFFPAEAAGGLPALKAFSAVFGEVHFCPTGGITLDKAPDWLALDSVACVGGSWLVPSGERCRPRGDTSSRPSARVRFEPSETCSDPASTCELPMTPVSIRIVEREHERSRGELLTEDPAADRRPLPFRAATGGRAR